MKIYICFIIKMFLLFPVINLSAQNFLSKEQAIDSAIKNHPQMNVANMQVEQQILLKGQSWNVPNAELLWQAPTSTFYTPGILLAIDNPLTYISQSKAQSLQIAITEAEREILKNNLIYAVLIVYNELQYLIEREKLLSKQDSLFASIAQMNEVRYKLGDITNLEKINSEAKFRTIRTELLQTRLKIKKAKMQFSLSLGLTNDTTYLPKEKLKKLMNLFYYMILHLLNRILLIYFTSDRLSLMKGR